MRKRVLLAVDAKIAAVVHKVRLDAWGFKVKSSADNRALVLHQTFGYITDHLLPAADKEIIEYCLKVGVRDPEFIADKIVRAYTDFVASIGPSFTASEPGVNPGSALRRSEDYRMHVIGFANNALARARIAIEERRPSDPTFLKKMTNAAENNPVAALCIAVAGMVAVLERGWIGTFLTSVWYWARVRLSR